MPRARRSAVLAVLALSLCGASSCFLSRSRPSEPLSRLARLYEESRYFELRDALALMDDRSSPDLEFFRGAVDQVFNRLDSAVSRLRRYLRATERSPSRTLNKEAWTLLADAFRRQGRYREAGQAYRTILDRFGGVLDGDAKTNYADQAELWAALAGIPRPSVEVETDTVVRMTDRLFPVRVGERTFFVGHDTGSNMSILYASTARELGVRTYGPSVRVQTGTGKWVQSRTGVLPELRLGSAVVRNAVFLVMPDELFPPAADRRGLLGAPILEGLGEFSETAEGDLIVPAHPRPRTPQNMCFSGFMPVVEVSHRGARLSLCVDTGSAATFLYPPFFRRYRGEILSRTAPRRTRIGGVGGSRTVAIRILDEFAFRLGARDVSLRRVMVHTEETHADSRYFYGTLGTDVLGQCARMTFNFVSMSFVLE